MDRTISLPFTWLQKERRKYRVSIINPSNPSKKKKSDLFNKNYRAHSRVRRRNCQ